MSVSASLVSYIAHTTRALMPVVALEGETVTGILRSVARALDRRRGPPCHVPVVVTRASKGDPLPGGTSLREEVESGARRLEWGRIEIGSLVQWALHADDLHPDDVYGDLGGPVGFHAPKAVAALPSWQTSLARTGGSDLELILIDEGDPVAGASPLISGLTTYHAAALQPALHAERVLQVLLGSIDASLLGRTRLGVSLIEPRGTAVGLRSLQHQWTSEILTALKAVDAGLRPGSTPVVMNLSFGTHGGPHDPSNVIDDALRQIVGGHGRPIYPVTSAGNDGRRRIAARGDIDPSCGDWFTLLLGSSGATEALAEFWFQGEPHDPDFHFGVDASLVDAAGHTLFSKSATDVTQVASSLPTPSTKYQDLSVIATRCPHDMWCVTVMVTAPSRAHLSGHEVRVFVETRGGKLPLRINAWLVVGEAEGVTLSGPRSEGSLSVPGADPDHVLCVGGIDPNGTASYTSPSGPASDYLHYGSPDPRITRSPCLVAPDAGPGAQGTSFAAARVSARCAELLLGRGCFGAAADVDHMRGHLLEPVTTSCPDAATKLSKRSWHRTLGWGRLAP